MVLFGGLSGLDCSWCLVAVCDGLVVVICLWLPGCGGQVVAVCSDLGVVVWL